jgi:hypothetical protein
MKYLGHVDMRKGAVVLYVIRISRSGQTVQRQVRHAFMLGSIASFFTAGLLPVPDFPQNRRSISLVCWEKAHVIVSTYSLLPPHPNLFIRR